MKDLKSVEAELASYTEIIARIDLLKRVEVGYSIAKHLKKDDIVKLAYIKEQYDDEGLGEGVHIDFGQEALDEMYGEYDYNSDYRERVSQLPEHLVKLVETLNFYYYKPEYKSIIKNLEYAMLPTDIDSLMGTVIDSSKIFEAWRVERNILNEKDAVTEVVDVAVPKTKKTKL